jgi:NDP-sugar pyrophosphorylase family protein
MDLTLVVLAAGLSTRYGEAKQLVPVGPSGEALMDYGIYDALRAGFNKVVLVTRRELEDALRAHVERVFGDAIAVAVAYQELDALPEGFSVPSGRHKPWGTGHAVLSASSEVNEPFVAINADDFYGSDAYVALGRHLREVAESGSLEFAAAGYSLRDTLSPHGGVSRAVCEVDADDYLERVTEVKKIAEADGVLAGVTVKCERYVLSGDETISMNIWAATPAAFPLLREQFAGFLEEHGADPDAEFLLSTAVNDLIGEDHVRVKVIPTNGPWLGVTYQEDRPYVMEKLGRLVEEGLYPEDLSKPLREE